MDGAAERAEVRAFRPVLAWRLTRSPTQASSPTRPLARRLPLPLGQVLEWRAILEAHGFLDTLLYEVDPSPHPSPNPNPNPSPNPGPSPNPSPSPSPNPNPKSRTLNPEPEPGGRAAHRDHAALREPAAHLAP